MQKKVDTLTGRELTRKIELKNRSAEPGRLSSAGKAKREAASRAEYRWNVQDDEDKLEIDLLAPKISSY